MGQWQNTGVTGQFDIADARSPRQWLRSSAGSVTSRVERLGRGTGGRPMSEGNVIANGKPVKVELPCTLEKFLRQQNLLPRSVVVEQNGEAVAPSEFAQREVKPNDRLEIVKIVAGG